MCFLGLFVGSIQGFYIDGVCSIKARCYNASIGQREVVVLREASNR